MNFSETLCLVASVLTEDEPYVFRLIEVTF